MVIVISERIISDSLSHKVFCGINTTGTNHQALDFAHIQQKVQDIFFFPLALNIFNIMIF